MIFLPFGVFPGDVIDPDKLAEEFREAARIAGSQTHWQWKEDCFSQKSELLEQGSVVSGLYAGVQVNTNTAIGTKLVLDGSGVHENLWKIPYNRSLAEIGGGDVALEWESVYPELIFVSFSFNYLRKAYEDMFPDSITEARVAINNKAVPNVRLVVRVRIDGNDLPGAGIYEVPVDSLYRGSGLATPSASPTICFVTLVSAGAHNVSAFAGLKNFVSSTSWWKQEDSLNHFEEVPNEGVRIGARYMSVLRFGRGAMMGG